MDEKVKKKKKKKTFYMSGRFGPLLLDGKRPPLC